MHDIYSIAKYLHLHIRNALEQPHVWPWAHLLHKSWQKANSSLTNWQRLQCFSRQTIPQDPFQPLCWDKPGYQNMRSIKLQVIDLKLVSEKVLLVVIEPILCFFARGEKVGWVSRRAYWVYWRIIIFGTDERRNERESGKWGKDDCWRGDIMEGRSRSRLLLRIRSAIHIWAGLILYIDGAEVKTGKS